MRFCNYVLFVLLFACALNTEGQIHKSVLWTVSLDTSQQITISTGDMLWVKSPTFAAVPANLGKIFQISYDHSRLSLIAEKLVIEQGQEGYSYFEWHPGGNDYYGLSDVPEPGTLVLLGSGALGLAASLRHRLS